jgi:hypothetical protein
MMSRSRELEAARNAGDPERAKWLDVDSAVHVCWRSTAFLSLVQPVPAVARIRSAQKEDCEEAGEAVRDRYVVFRS